MNFLSQLGYFVVACFFFNSTEPKYTFEIIHSGEGRYLASLPDVALKVTELLVNYLLCVVPLVPSTTDFHPSSSTA